MRESRIVVASPRALPGLPTVIAAQRGDRQALEDLVSGCLPLLYNIIGRALNGHPDVDDVVQDTVLRLLRGISGLKQPTCFRSWLVAVAIHQVRDHHQSRQRSQTHQTTLEDITDIADPQRMRASPARSVAAARSISRWTIDGSTGDARLR